MEEIIMKKQKVWGLFCILSLALSFFSGCSKKEEAASAAGKVVKIAVVAPLTGNAAQYGEVFKRGMSIYVEEYNAKGGFKGAPVELTFFDDKNDAKEAVNICNIILAEGDYACVWGPFSSTCALAMAEVLDEEKMLTFAPSCSHPEYTKLYDYVFRMPAVNSEEARFAARYLKQGWNAKKTAAIYTNNDWGITVNEAFLKEAKVQGMEVVADESFILGQTKDFSPLLTKIKAAGADSVYLICQYTEAAQILIQAESLCPNINMVISTSACQPEALNIAKEAGMKARYISTLPSAPTETMVRVQKLVTERYNAKVDNFFSYGYNAAMVALTALSSAGTTDPDAWKEAVLAIGDYPGIDVPFKIRREDRNIERPFFIAVDDGARNFKNIDIPVIK
jgi:branched-chain amino acid transport system substrate-binding protein